MELPIVSTTHVPGREQVVRAWGRALEMVGGATDGLVAREGYQRVFVTVAKGTPWHDCAFGFGRDVKVGELGAVLKGDEVGLPFRVVPEMGWGSGDLERELGPMGYTRRELYVGVLGKTRMDWEVREDLQVLPARAVYGDVAALKRAGLELMLEEARLDMLVLRDGSGLVAAYGTMITVNTMGLIVDFYVRDGTGDGMGETMLWYLLELCSRSQHKSVGVVMDPGIAFEKLFTAKGFVSLAGLDVWDLNGCRPAE